MPDIVTYPIWCRPDTQRSSPIRILVADDHDVVRYGMTAILERHPGWIVCAEAKSGPEAVALAEQHKPDMIVLDVNMPGLNGVETLREIRRRMSAPKVVFLTLHCSPGLLQAIVQAGGLGYVLKSDADRDLVAAVESVSQGRPYFTKRIDNPGDTRTSNFPEAIPQSSSPAIVAGHLTSREREAVRTLAQTMRKLL